MNRRTLLQSIPALAILSSTIPASAQQDKISSGMASPPCYELRVYHCYEGKLDDLLKRFREHTMTIFEKHNIRNVAYWTPTDDPLKGRTLFYIIAHASRDAATTNWAEFRADPEWQKVQQASEANGKLVEKVDSTFMVLTDFSPRV